MRWEDVDLEDGLVRVTSSRGRTFRWAVMDRVAIERLQAWQACDTSTGRVFPVNSRTLQRDVVRLVACRRMLCVGPCNRLAEEGRLATPCPSVATRDRSGTGELAALTRVTLEDDEGEDFLSRPRWSWTRGGCVWRVCGNHSTRRAGRGDSPGALSLVQPPRQPQPSALG